MSADRESVLARLASDKRLKVHAMRDGWGYLSDVLGDELNFHRDEEMFQIERTTQGMDKSQSDFFIDPELTKELLEIQEEEAYKRPWNPRPIKALRQPDPMRMMTITVDHADTSWGFDRKPIRHCYRLSEWVWAVNIPRAYLCDFLMELGKDSVFYPEGRFPSKVPHVTIYDDYIE